MSYNRSGSNSMNFRFNTCCQICFAEGIVTTCAYICSACSLFYCFRHLSGGKTCVRCQLPPTDSRATLTPFSSLGPITPPFFSPLGGPTPPPSPPFFAPLAGPRTTAFVAPDLSGHDLRLQQKIGEILLGHPLLSLERATEIARQKLQDEDLRADFFEVNPDDPDF